MTQQTNELDRLPSWSNNKPDFNPIDRDCDGSIHSRQWWWVVGEDRDVEGKGDMGVESVDTCILFRSLCHSFYIRLEVIHFVDDRDMVIVLVFE